MRASGERSTSLLIGVVIAIISLISYWSMKEENKFDFNLLADGQTVNAFALPGGPIFITKALLARMTDEAQVAGVLSHEIGHVVARHAAEQAAKTQLGQGLVGAVAVGTSNDSGFSAGGQMAHFVAQMTLMKYGRQDELQSDATIESAIRERFPNGVEGVSRGRTIGRN